MGDLVLRDRERSQPRAGRLDLLLEDPEAKRRYEVELQLGATRHILFERWSIGISNVSAIRNTIIAQS